MMSEDPIYKGKFTAMAGGAFLTLVAALISLPAYAAPSVDELMQGIPPAPEVRVTKANWFVGPYNRWGLQLIREIVATTEISRCDRPLQPLPSTTKPIGAAPRADRSAP